MRRPANPPFPVGTRVRYNSVEFGHGEPIRCLRRGEVGIVIKTTPGSAATGLELGDDEFDDEPSDGWSTVRYLDDPGFDRAFTREDVRLGLCSAVPAPR